MISSRGALCVALGIAVASAGCTARDATQRMDRIASSAAAGTAIGRSSGSGLVGWHPPSMDSLDSLGNDPLVLSIRRGVALMLHTRDSLPAHDPSSLSCASCHLDAGRHENAIPLFGVHGIYPEYNSRANAVIPIEERINFCFTRSLAGSRVQADSPEMRDIVAYLAFLSRGIPGGAQPFPGKLPEMPKLVGDSAIGSGVYAQRCARCHGADGAGNALTPALWGARSFTVGASMARAERAASFIQHNMPLDSAGTLANQEAFDVAAFVTTHPRPDMPGKELDWPRGDAPADVPYATAGHRGVHPPELLPRTKGGLGTRRE